MTPADARRRRDRHAPSRLSGLGALAAAMIIAIGTGLAGCRCERVDSSWVEPVPFVELRRLMERSETEPAALVLIDARAPEAFADGHLPGAVNLQITDFPKQGRRDARIDAFRHIIVYGQGPGSAGAEAMVKRLWCVGYNRIRLFDEGVDGWVGVGLDLETGSADLGERLGRAGG